MKITIKSILTKTFSIFLVALLCVGIISVNTNEIKAESKYRVEVIKGFGQPAFTRKAAKIMANAKESGYSIVGYNDGQPYTSTSDNNYQLSLVPTKYNFNIVSYDVIYGEQKLNGITSKLYIDSNGNLTTSSSGNSEFITVSGITATTSTTKTTFYLRFIGTIANDLTIRLNPLNGTFNYTINNVESISFNNHFEEANEKSYVTKDGNNFSFKTNKIASYSDVNTIYVTPLQNKEIVSISTNYGTIYQGTISKDDLGNEMYFNKVTTGDKNCYQSSGAEKWIVYNDNTFTFSGASYNWTINYNYENKITFNANGGIFEDQSNSKEYITTNDVLTSLPEDPTNGDMKFMGWYDDATDGNQIDISTYTFSENITLYAHWADANANTVTIVNATNSDGDPITTLDDSVFSSFNGSGVLTIASNKEASFVAHASYGNLKSLTIGETTIELGDLETLKYINSDFSVSDSEGDNPLLKVVYDSTNRLFNIDLINVENDLLITLDYDKSNVKFNVDHRETVTKQVDFGSTVLAADSGLNNTKWYLDDSFESEYDFSSPVYDDVDLYAKSHKITLYKGYRTMPASFVRPNNSQSFFGSSENDYSYTTYTAGDFNSDGSPSEYRFAYKASADTVTLASFDVYYGNSEPLIGLVAQNYVYVDESGNINTSGGRQLLAIAGVSAHSAATTIYMRLINNPLEDVTIVWHYTNEFPITIKNVDGATCSDEMPGNFKYDANTKTASYSGNYQNNNGMSFVVNPISNVEIESIYVSLNSGDSKYETTIPTNQINNHFFLKKVKNASGVATSFDIVDSFVSRNDTPLEYNGSTNTIKITELANDFNIEYKYRSKVTFNANGGSFVDSDTTKEYYTVNNKLAEYPGKKDLVNDGYKFVGWYDDPTDGELVDLTQDIITNTTLYAHWAEATINKISFVNAINADGLDGITSLDSAMFDSFDATNLEATIAYNKKATIKAYATHGTIKGIKVGDFEVDDLSKTYYINKDSEISETSSDNDMISISYNDVDKYFNVNILKLTDDIQIELIYEDINITYHILDGTVIKQVDFNSAIPEEHTPSIKEHKFLGFYYDDSYETAYNNEKFIDDVDIYCSFSDYYLLTIENAEKANSTVKYSASTWKNESPAGVTFDENEGTIAFDGAWQDSQGKQVLVYSNKGIVTKLTITYGEKEFVIDGDNLYEDVFLKENGEFGDDGDSDIFLKFAGSKNYIFNHQFYIKPFIVNHDINVEIEYTSTITYDCRDGVDSRYNFDLYTPKTSIAEKGNIAYVDSSTFSNNIGETGDAGISGGVVRLIVAPYNDKMTGLTMTFERYDATSKGVINDVVTYTYDYLNGLSSKRKDVNNDYANYRIVISGGSYMIKFAKLNCNVTIRPIAADSVLEEGAVINNDGTLKLNFVLHSFKYIDTEKAYVTFDDGVTKTYLNELSMGKDGKGARTFTAASQNFEIQNIVDTFTVKFVDEDGNSIKEVTTSLVEYLNTLLEMDTISDDTKTFIKTMLNYAANCQILFEHDVDNLANKNLEEEDKDLSGIEKDDNDNFVISGTTEGIKPVGLNLALNEAVDLNVYFNVDKEHDIDDFTFEYNGQELEPTQYSGRQYYVTIGSVAAPDLGNRYPIVVKNSDEQGNLTVELSVYTFVYLTLDRYAEDVEQEYLVNAMKALYAYGNSANGVKEEITSIVTILDNLEPYDGNRLKLAFIGDSITYGYNPNATDEHIEYSYPAQLGRLLGNKFDIGDFGKSSSYIIPSEFEYSAHYTNGQNERLSYKKTYEYQESLTYNPDVVFIMLGTNDRHSLNASQTSYEVFKESLTDLVNIYKGLPSVKKVFILTSIVSITDDENIGASGKAFAHALSDGPLQELQKEVAAECNIDVIDVFGETRDSFYNNQDSYYSTDKLHPKKEGYALIANTIKDYLIGDKSYDNSTAGLFYTNLTNTIDNDPQTFAYYMQGGADPFVLYEDGIFYMYVTTGKTYKKDGSTLTTSGGFDVYTSTDLTHWKHEADKVFTPGGDKSWGHINVWAPEVIKEDNKYYLFYSAHYGAADDTNQLFYISVATSDSPDGKFREYEGNGKTKAEPLLQFEKHVNEIPESLRTTIKGYDGTEGFIKVIDASPFVDPNTGKKYLYMVSDLGMNGPAEASFILGMEMEDWTTPKYNTLTRLTEYGKKTVGGESIQEYLNTNEGPSMYYHDGKYYLTFSTGNYGSELYQVRQAIGDNPLGTFEKVDPTKGGVVLSTSTTTIRQSAGHHGLFKVGDELFAAYHTFYNDENYNDSENAWFHRKAAVDRVEFVKNSDGIDVMQIMGTTLTPQLLPTALSGYSNIARNASISATNTNASSNINLLNDGYVSLNGIKVKDNYVSNSGENKITYTFDSQKTVRGILVYNSDDTSKQFSSIKSCILHTLDGDIEYNDIAYKPITKDGKIAIDQTTNITFYETVVSSIDIIFNEETSFEIPEILIVGR